MRIPNRKVSIIFLITVIITITIIVTSEISTFTDSKTPSVTYNPNIEITVSGEAKNDSDGDGLFDWEEVLWGTDKMNADTDGDGTNDGDEVSENRDPTKAGPDDANMSYIDKILKVFEDNPVNQNSLTNKIAVSVAEDYFITKNNASLTEEEKKQRLNDIIESKIQGQQLIKRYGTSAIKTFNAYEDPDELLLFAEGFTEKQAKLIEQSPLLSSLQGTKEMAVILMRLADDLILMKTPSELVVPQTKIANIYYNLGYAMVNMWSEEDPVMALIGYQQYKTLMEELSINIDIVKNFFQKYNIVSDGDGHLMQIDIDKDINKGLSDLIFKKS